MQSQRISLARILALGVPFDWQDAAAIVREAAVAAQMNAGWTGVPSLVRADTCFIAPDGTVELPSPAEREEPEAVAALLEMLLAGRDAPATVAGLARSGRDLARALSTASTGDRGARIGALAARALAADAGRPTPTPRAAPVVARYADHGPRPRAVDGATPPENWPIRRGHDAQRMRWFLAAAAVSAVTLVGFAWRATPKVAASAEGPFLPWPTRSRLPMALLTKAVARAAAAPPAGATPAPAPPTSVVHRLGTGVAGGDGAPRPAAAAAENDPVPPPAVAEATAADDVLYSAADAEVQAPALRAPAAGVLGPHEAVPDDWPFLEVVVGPAGDVEEARLGSNAAAPGPPQDRHRQLLDAALSWRFAPATRDGAPVRYRVRLPLEP